MIVGVVTDVILKVLEGFHHQVAWRIAGMPDQRVREGGWEWSLMVEALKAAGMWKMKDYICRCQVTIFRYIFNHPIYEL